MENPYYGEPEHVIADNNDELSPQRHEQGFSTITALENVYYEEST